MLRHILLYQCVSRFYPYCILQIVKSYARKAICEVSHPGTIYVFIGIIAQLYEKYVYKRIYCVYINHYTT